MTGLAPRELYRWDEDGRPTRRRCLDGHPQKCRKGIGRPGRDASFGMVTGRAERDRHDRSRSERVTHARRPPVAVRPVALGPASEPALHYPLGDGSDAGALVELRRLAAHLRAGAPGAGA
ncbi:DUF6177 family protein [Streptomyces calvus]